MFLCICLLIVGTTAVVTHISSSVASLEDDITFTESYHMCNNIWKVFRIRNRSKLTLALLYITQLWLHYWPYYISMAYIILDIACCNWCMLLFHFTLICSGFWSISKPTMTYKSTVLCENSCWYITSMSISIYRT